MTNRQHYRHDQKCSRLQRGLCCAFLVASTVTVLSVLMAWPVWLALPALGASLFALMGWGGVEVWRSMTH